MQQPFNMQGFMLMTLQHEGYDGELENFRDEYHGAMICLADTKLLPTLVEVIGPYGIENHQAECKRMEHLHAFMSADTRDRLVSAFKMYTGCKPDVVPGFWTVSATSKYLVGLYATSSMGAHDSIVGSHCGGLCFSVQQDVDGSDA
ncbi:hypothetical protein BGZ93_004214 [Podila epicladia]|nr:hypothetical protein BGZ92_009232 [Podila epicladia]KAG0096635.1 hypothetical protein BGZ93_004214 [Podila epicladia]